MSAQVSMPARIAALPRDKHGRPIPWFVLIDEHGVPDFRVARAEGFRDAMQFDLCWVCGQHRGRWASFVIGPMCAVNRVSSEPPSHRDCALYSAQACPFLATPTMVRRERGLPEDRDAPAGVMVLRNPGVALVWSSKTWSPVRVPPGVGPTSQPGMLFDIGEATEALWFAHGRDATRQEVLASIESGLPALVEAAQHDGKNARTRLAHELDRAMTLVPGDVEEDRCSTTQ